MLWQILQIVTQFWLSSGSIGVNPHKHIQYPTPKAFLSKLYRFLRKLQIHTRFESAKLKRRPRFRPATFAKAYIVQPISSCLFFFAVLRFDKQ